MNNTSQWRSLGNVLEVVALHYRDHPRVLFGSRSKGLLSFSLSALCLVIVTCGKRPLALNTAPQLAMPVLEDHPGTGIPGIDDDASTTCCPSEFDNSQVEIDFSTASTVTCRMCGCSALDSNPLEGAAGEVTPWAKYRLVSVAGANGVTQLRKPTGRSCAICRNVFNALGLDAEHDSLATYYKHACKPENAKEFRAFVGSRSDWISQHNKDGSQVRLKGAKEMQTRFTTLKTKTTNKRTFEAPEEEFISKEAWDPNKDGPYDESKEVSEEIMGVMRFGIYVLRGRKGVFRVRQKESVGTERETIEDDGKGPFAAERLDNKMKVIRAGQTQLEKERAQKCVEKPGQDVVQSMMELLQQCGAVATGGVAEAQAAQAAAAPGDGTGVAAKKEPDSSDDDGECTGTKRAVQQPSRLMSLFRSVKPTNAVSSGASSAVASRASAVASRAKMAGASPARQSVAQQASPARVGHGHGAAEPSLTPKKQLAAALAITTATFDGRTRRLYESLVANCNSLQDELATIKFEEELSVVDKKLKSQLAEVLKAKGRKLAKLQGDINNNMNRIKQSASQASLDDIRERLQALSNNCTKVSKFHSIVASPAPEPDQFFQARSALSDIGIELGFSYYKFDLSLQGRQAMLRNDTNALCSMCLSGDSRLHALTRKGCSEPDLADVATGLILNASLEVSGKLLLADVPKEVTASATKGTLAQLLVSIKSFSEMAPWLPAPEVTTDILFWESFIDPTNVCVKKLSHDLSLLETKSTEATRSGSLCPTLQFLVEGTVGLRLVAHAETVCQNRKEEVECDELIADLQEKFDAVVKSSPFYNETEHAISDDDLQTKGLKDYFEAAAATSEKLQILPGAKKKVGSLGKTYIQRASDIQVEMWTVLKMQFKKMFVAMLNDVIDLLSSAITNNGLDESGQLVDLAAMESLFQVDELVNSPHLQSPLAQQCKFHELVVGHKAKAQSLFDAAKFVLVSSAPRLAALNEVVANDADVKRFAGVLCHTRCLCDLGIDTDRSQKFIAVMKPKVDAIVEARGSVVFDHVKNTIDLAMGDSISGLSEQSVKDLVRRLPQSCPHGALITEVLMSRVLSDTVADSFNAKVACDIFQRLSKARSMIAAWGGEQADKAKLFFGADRLAAVEAFLQTKASSLRAAICEARDALILQAAANVKCVAEFAEDLHVHDEHFNEADFMTKMRINAKTFAEKQKDIEKAVSQLHMLFNSLGQSFEKDSKQEYDDAETSIGCVVYIIALYTAATLYRSPLLGKRTTHGQQAMANLKTVIESVNAKAGAVRVEIAFKNPLMSQLRAFANVPLKVPVAAAAAEGADASIFKRYKYTYRHILCYVLTVLT